MNVKDIMVKDVVFADSDDFISSALAKMKARKISQLIVRSNGSFSGVIELKNIVTKDIDPAKTKVGGISKKSVFLKADQDVDSAASTLISNGIRALPVMDGGKVVGILSETDILKTISDSADTNSEIGSIKSKFVYAKRDDNIGKIKHLMLNESVSRIPIVEGGRVIGVVSTLDMIKALEAKTGFESRSKTKDPGFKEKKRVEELKAETIMSDAVTVKKSSKIKNVIKLLQDNEQVILEDGEIGIITPKDIMELFLSKPSKQAYVQITGMQEEDVEFRDEMDFITTKFVQKMGKSFRHIQGLFVHVEKHGKQGGTKPKYSIRTRFITERGIFVSSSSGWGPIEVIQDAFRKLEKEIRHIVGKKDDRRSS